MLFQQNGEPKSEKKVQLFKENNNWILETYLVKVDHFNLFLSRIIEETGSHVIDGIGAKGTYCSIARLQSIMNRSHDLHKYICIKRKCSLLMVAKQNFDEAKVGLAQFGLSIHVVHRNRQSHLQSNLQRIV